MDPVPSVSEYRQPTEMVPIVTEEPKETFFQKGADTLTRIVQKVFDSFHPPSTLLKPAPKTTIEDLPSEVLLRIFSTLPGNTCMKCASTCKGFNSLSQEQTIRQAEALYKMNQETGLLKKFGVSCEERIMTIAAARDMFTQTKKLVKRCDWYRPDTFFLKQSLSDLLTDSVALKSFLEQTCKYFLLKALGKESRVPENASLDDKVKHIREWIKSDAGQGLVELNLRCRGLLIIPREICELKGLQKLDLRNNELTSIPPEIGQLIALQRLDLSVNFFTSIPAEIGKLLALRWLNVSCNRLMSIPAEISGLRVLQCLKLFYNKLVSIPVEIGELRALRGLDLSNNLLASIPTEISGLTVLQCLRLSHNNLTSIPVELSRLTKLKWLYLENNKLTSLPEAVIKQLSVLLKFDLRGNKLDLSPHMMSKKKVV